MIAFFASVYLAVFGFMFLFTIVAASMETTLDLRGSLFIKNITTSVFWPVFAIIYLTKELNNYFFASKKG